MNRNKRVNISENNLTNKVVSNMFLDASKDYVLISDEDLTEKWEKLRDEIKTFYSEEYVDILIRHAKLFNELNKMSLSLLQRRVFTPDQIRQSSELLKNCLEEILERYRDEK